MTSTSAYEYFLIDDEEIIRDLWHLSASQNNFYLGSAPSFQEEEFKFHILPKITQNTVFFVDYYLGPNALDGEEVCHRLHNLGIQHLYISSGNLNIKLDTLPFVTGIVAKLPPWTKTNKKPNTNTGATH